MSDVSKIDFEDYKNQLIEYLKENQTQFKDYDFTGSNMNVLLDVLSYNTFQNTFYNQMVISETFLDSAKLKSSVVSHAKSLNYLPRSKRSAIAKIKLTLAVDDLASFVTIPVRTKFTTSSEKYSGMTLYTNETYVITPLDGEYISEEISLYEGVLASEKYFVNANTKYYKIQNKDIDLDTLKVYITNSVGEIEEYKRVENLYGLKKNSKVFFIQMTDENYEIYFGDGVFGYTPKTNNIITLDYLVSSGRDGNGIGKIRKSELISGYSVSGIELVARGVGGAEKESISSIKFNAPKSIQIQERAVTENDYEVLLKRNFPEIQGISVIGGEKISPPQYGKVIVYIDSKKNNGISEQTKFRITNFLKERTPLGITPIIEQPSFFFLEVDTKVIVDANNTKKVVADLKKEISADIVRYNLENLNDFNSDFYHSKFIAMIDEVNENIMSNETSVRIFSEPEVEFNKANSFTINFNNALTPIADYAIRSLQSQVPNHPYIPKLDAERADRLPTIASSSFKFNGMTVYLRDNGFGSLQIIRNTDDVDIIVRKNVGTVNYNTGLVVVKNLYIESMLKTFRIYANTKNKNIKCPTGSILSISQPDIMIKINNKDE